MKDCKLFILFLTFIKLSRCNEYLLPKTVTPKAYDLKVITTLDENTDHDFSFNGEINICVRCNKRTNRITLHSKNLHIRDVNLLVRNHKINNVINFNFEPKYDFLHINLRRKLINNRHYIIRINFNGSVSNELSGYYRSSYKNKGDTKKTWLAVTKFEPTFARNAFPCFDEPAYKATFKIQMGHRKDLHSISNMPEVNTIPIKGSMYKDYTITTFKKTVPMSTYLVAYMVSDFESIKSPPGLSKTEFKIWARKDALSQVQFARIVGPKALSFFEKYFNIPYPLPKQDMVALPDFASGAMENWGLITYRETALLYDPKIGSSQSQERVASTICHELAHQWFGNLVTMKWWNDLWLNEGFATYMAVVCVHALFPQWDYRLRTILNTIEIVYKEDSFVTSYPLSANVSNPSDIALLFGAIAYKKGASVINMMEGSLGEKVLRTGVTNYLKKHSYKNAEQDDLWAALSEAAHKAKAIPRNLSIKTIMDSWTLHNGYPVINVIRNYATGSVTITQEKYLRYLKTKPKSNFCWWIPITYATADKKEFKNVKPKFWLPCPQKSITINYNKPKNWIIFNLVQTGLYAVNYDTTNWKLIINHLKNKSPSDINVANRCAVMENLMSFAALGIADYELVFDLLNYLEREKSVLVWQNAFKHLNQLWYLMYGCGVSPCPLEVYIRRILNPQYKKFDGFNVKTNESVDFRKLISSRACFYGVEECRNDAVALFNTFMKNSETNPIHKEMRTIVYCTAINLGDEKEWNFLWEQYKESNYASEKNLILEVLSCTKNIDTLNKYLHDALNGNNIRAQDANKVFSSVASRLTEYENTTNFFYSNGEQILKLITAKRFCNLLTTIAKSVTDQNKFVKFETFLNQTSVIIQQCNLQVNHAKEIIEFNLQWHKTEYQKVVRILNAQNATNDGWKYEISYIQ